MRWLSLCVVLAGCAPELREVDPAAGPGAASAVWESPDGSYRLEAFSWGDANAVSDFLFVIDPSISMSTVVDRVRAGFASLAEGGAFPAKARVGVMTMVPWRAPNRRERRWRAEQGEPALATMMPDKAVRVFPGIGLLPGLGALVDAEAIARFKGAGVAEGLYEGVVGCDAWFEPGAVDSQGVPCLVAHTQLVLEPIKAEAGLIALNRLVRSPQGDGLFRPGASVNIIFVSDTHDPGLADPDFRPASARLADVTPTGAAVEGAILARYAPAGVRLHAIAPHTECGEVWSPLGPTYLRAAEQTGGLTLDVCATSDYGPFIREVATVGAVAERGFLPLGKPADAVRSVVVDARPTDFTVRDDGRVLEVPALQAGVRARVEVGYDVGRRPARRPRQPEADAVPVAPPAPVAPAAAPVTTQRELRPAKAPTPSR